MIDTTALSTSEATVESIGYHPACLVLPGQTDDEFNSLVESLKLGWDVRHPILMHEGQILRPVRFKNAILCE